MFFVGEQFVKNFFPISLSSLGANRYNFEKCSKAIHKKSKCEGHWRLEWLYCSRFYLCLQTVELYLLGQVTLHTEYSVVSLFSLLLFHIFIS